MARKHFPNTTLLVNEYNIEMNWNNCRAPYIAMVQAIKNAPNLTDGQKNLIDGVGLQCHGIDNLTAANFKACIDEIWTSINYDGWLLLRELGFGERGVIGEIVFDTADNRVGDFILVAILF